MSDLVDDYLRQGFVLDTKMSNDPAGKWAWELIGQFIQPGMSEPEIQRIFAKLREQYERNVQAQRADLEKLKAVRNAKTQIGKLTAKSTINYDDLFIGNQYTTRSDDWWYPLGAFPPSRAFTVSSTPVSAGDLADIGLQTGARMESEVLKWVLAWNEKGQAWLWLRCDLGIVNGQWETNLFVSMDEMLPVTAKANEVEPVGPWAREVRPLTLQMFRQHYYDKAYFLDLVVAGYSETGPAPKQAEPMAVRQVRKIGA